MDIHSAGTNVKKLLAYVEDLADKKPKMYEKSKDRLKEIATTCNQVVVLISDILEDEMLKDDSVEFGQRSDIDAVLNNMQYQIDKIKKFTQQTSPEESAKRAEIATISSNVRKKALRNYSISLSKLSNADTGYPFADRCAKLLWTWFDVRFLKTVQGTSFRYNMKKFPEWIQSIVILYGKAIRENTVAEFEDTFQNWLQTLITTDAKNKYAVPYEVYSIAGKSIEASTLTLDAVILWDILLDNGLRELCTADKGDLYLDEYGLYDICNKKNSEVLEDYCNYERHPEIFAKLGWEVMNDDKKTQS